MVVCEMSNPHRTRETSAAQLTVRQGLAFKAGSIRALLPAAGPLARGWGRPDPSAAGQSAEYGAQTKPAAMAIARSTSVLVGVICLEAERRLDGDISAVRNLGL